MRIQDIRKMFPALSQTVYGKPLVYFDNAATAQRPESVVRKMESLALGTNANIHRAVHKLASEATEEYESTRDVVREYINAESRQEVVFVETETIGAESERDVHHLGIFLGLLSTVTDGVVGILSLYDSNGSCAIEVEHVVGILSLATSHNVASQVYLTIGKLHLSFHSDIINRPLFAKNGWSDVSQLDVFL